jgi:hypothetical protein
LLWPKLARAAESVCREEIFDGLIDGAKRGVRIGYQLLDR